MKKDVKRLIISFCLASLVITMAFHFPLQLFIFILLGGGFLTCWIYFLWSIWTELK